MATALQNGDLLACRVWATLGNQAAVNTYNYQIFGVTGGACTDQDLCNAVNLLVVPFYKGLMTTDCDYNGVQCYFLRRTGFLPGPVKTIVSAGPGLNSPPPLSPNAAIVLKYNTVIRGPGGRGRVFLPFSQAANLDGAGNTTTGFDVFANSFLSTMLPVIALTNGGSAASATWTLIRHATGTPPTATGQIIFAESSGKVGQMHKRGAYGRLNSSPI